MNFLNPWYFLGMLSLGAPLLLHLVRRERAQKILFPTLMLLRRVSKKTIRYQHLKQLLLLLLRMLALGFLVLAFTRPYLNRAGIALTIARRPTLHILLLDNSMSMGYGDRWERAKKAVADTIQQLPSGDRIALLEFSNITSIRVEPTTDTAAITGYIDRSAELSHRATDLLQALKIAVRVAADSTGESSIIHLISDFQKSGISPEAASFKLPAGIEVKGIDVGSTDFSNLALGDVRIIEGGETAAGSWKIGASIINFGGRDRRGVGVRLLIDSRLVAEQKVDVGKGMNQKLGFLLPKLNPGMHSAVVEVADPELKQDNRYYFLVDERGKTPVLAVENPRSGPGGRSPSFFLNRALNISSLSNYQLTTQPAQEAHAGRLGSARVIIWNNASGGGTVFQQKLQEFVRRGGGLAIVVADSASAADFNRTFGAWLPFKIETNPTRVQPARGRSPADSHVLLTDLRLDHPIFQPFRDPHSGSFVGARFYTHARITLTGKAEALARFENGDVAVAAAGVERGRVLILGFSADDSGTDLPLKPVFAPFWHQILRFLDQYEEARHSFEVGDIISVEKLITQAQMRLAAPPDLLETSVAVMDPSKHRLVADAGNDSMIVEISGFYEIRSPGTKTMVAVNPVLRESDLSHANADELVAGWMTPRVPAGAESLIPGKAVPAELDTRSRLWQMLLIAFLLFFLAEGILSNRSLPGPE